MEKINVAVREDDYKILRDRTERGVSLADVVHAALVAAGWIKEKKNQQRD